MPAPGPHSRLIRHCISMNHGTLRIRVLVVQLEQVNDSLLSLNRIFALENKSNQQQTRIVMRVEEPNHWPAHRFRLSAWLTSVGKNRKCNLTHFVAFSSKNAVSRRMVVVDANDAISMSIDTRQPKPISPLLIAIVQCVNCRGEHILSCLAHSTITWRL